jgi:hypothetical protein
MFNKNGQIEMIKNIWQMEKLQSAFNGGGGWGVSAVF